MNKIKKTSFLQWLFYLLLIFFLLITFFMITYYFSTLLQIKLPNEPAISVITQIDYFNLFKIFIFVGFVYFFLFSLPEMFMLFRVRKAGRKLEDLNIREKKIIESLFRILLGCYIPTVALFALSINQFSAIVEISALFTIFIFFFNLGKINKWR